MTERQDINIDELRKRLLDKKTELLASSERSAGSRAAVELDQTRQGRLSRMDAMQQQEMAKETERRRRIDLQRIESALARIEIGDYGYCVKCDEDIASGRLAFDPAIATCVDCAAGRE